MVVYLGPGGEENVEIDYTDDKLVTDHMIKRYKDLAKKDEQDKENRQFKDNSDQPGHYITYRRSVTGECLNFNRDR